MLYVYLYLTQYIQYLHTDRRVCVCAPNWFILTEKMYRANAAAAVAAADATLASPQRTFDVVDTFVVVVAGQPSASVSRASTTTATATTPLSTFIMAFCQIQNSDSRALAMTACQCVHVYVCVCVCVWARVCAAWCCCCGLLRDKHTDMSVNYLFIFFLFILFFLSVFFTQVSGIASCVCVCV